MNTSAVFVSMKATMSISPYTLDLSLRGNITRARGVTDNASDFGSEDCRFESCRARYSICIGK
ncbi:hypothetical protein T06_14095 [Trichinella sp. T6]|nr:hypothetical protein T06_14095 [Trichinella sp. T6]